MFTWVLLTHQEIGSKVNQDFVRCMCFFLTNKWQNILPNKVFVVKDEIVGQKEKKQSIYKSIK